MQVEPPRLSPAVVTRPLTHSICLGAPASRETGLRRSVAQSKRFRGATRRDGAVLLEVVLALVLFVGAATVISAGLNASLASAERLRLNTQASNLAVSVLSELQLGTKTTAVTGPQPFEAPFEGWTWEVIVPPLHPDSSDASGVRNVEVIVRNLETGFTSRASEVIRFPDARPAGEANAAASSVSR